MSPKTDIPKVAIVPAICPLYRLYVWEKLAELKSLDVTFFLETENNIDNIKYIPLDILNEKFQWKRIRNSYHFRFLWQKGVLKLPFSDYDMILFSGNIRCLSTWIASILARLMGKRVYFWTHGVYGKENRLSLFVKRIFLSIPNGNFFYGDLSLQKVLSWNFNKDHNHVIYNSLNYDFHKKMRESQSNENTYIDHFNNKNPVLLFIGRLTRIKKLEQLLLAAKKLENEGELYNIILIGDGPERERLQEISTDNNLHTWFYGECYDENELYSLISQADLCISPGNVGLTLMHCLSYGTPVITHNDFSYQMPEAEAIDPGFNGDFFERDSIEDLSQAIKNWFDKNKAVDRNIIKQRCYSVIDEKYNPYYQSTLIEKVALNNI